MSRIFVTHTHAYPCVFYLRMRLALAGVSQALSLLWYKMQTGIDRQVNISFTVALAFDYALPV